jgi:hypothetical protein
VRGTLFGNVDASPEASSHTFDATFTVHALLVLIGIKQTPLLLTFWVIFLFTKEQLCGVMVRLQLAQENLFAKCHCDFEVGEIILVWLWFLLLFEISQYLRVILFLFKLEVLILSQSSY